MNIQILSSISKDLHWIFDGIGTEIICVIVSLIIGTVSGGIIGYKAGVKNHIKLIAKAQNDANQQQTGSINIYNGK